MTIVALFEVDLAPTYFSVINSAIPLDILIWLLLYSGIPFLLEIFLQVLFAKLIKPSDILLHFDCFEDFVVLLKHLLLLLLSLLHFHELADLRFLHN